MKALILTLTAFSLLSSSLAFAQEQVKDHVLVKLSVVAGQGTKPATDKEEAKIELKGCKVEGYFTQCDNLSLHINNKEIVVPEVLLHQLFNLYTQTSYSYFSKAIQDNLADGGSGPICAMGGEGHGTILSTYYHTTSETSVYEVEKSEMKAIYSEAGNCLFRRDIRPTSLRSVQAATKMNIILSTIFALNN